MTYDPLTVRDLMAALQAVIEREPAAVGWPVVLAIDAEGTLGKPATSDTPVCTCGYQAGGDLTGETDNCVVIWPTV